MPTLLLQFKEGRRTEDCTAHNVRSTCFIKLEQKVPGLLDIKQQISVF